MKKWWARLKLIYHRWANWEYWPFHFFYFPILIYYAWLALKNRSFFFFTSSNPSIDFGGMLGEKKSEIFDLIPKKYLPKHDLFKPEDIYKAISFADQIGYPIIAKPDVGERGILVEKIDHKEALISYIQKMKVPFLIQELIDFPLEVGLFYVRIPGEQQGIVTSIVEKSFLHVIGNGQDSVKKLLSKNPRAQLQLDSNHPRLKTLLNRIPDENEKVIIEPIGNHSRGTTFLNGNEHITPKLTKAIDQIAQSIDGFYFGRFDMKVLSYHAIEDLNSIKILELNGAGSEPGHIYQPGYPLLRAYRDIVWHLNMLSKVSQENKRRGYPFMSFAEGMKKMRAVKKYQKAILKDL